MLADVGRALQHAGAAALTRQLHQTEGRDLAHLDAGAIVLEAVLELLLDEAVVLGLVHVDEVDDDQAGQVAQAQLARGFLGGLEVRLQRGRLDVALARGLARVDVDGDQGLGLVDHQVAARPQGRDRRIDLGEAVLDLVLDEQRRGPAVGLNLLGLRGHQHAHELAGLAEALFALDHHAVHVLVVHVADGPLHEVLFLVDQRRGDRLQGQVADVLPEPQQVLVVALDLGLGALGAGRAHDQAHAVGHLQALDDPLQPLAVDRRGDLAADAAAAGGVGHEHAVAARQRQVGGERGTLGPALVLDHLHQHDLPALDDLLDLVAAQEPAAASRQLLLHHVVVVLAAGLLAFGVGRVAGAAVAVGLVALVLFGLLAQQRLPVGDRDLVVVRVDLVEGQKAVPVAAILDEGGLQAGLDARDLGQIDVAAQLLARAALEVKLLDARPIHDGHTRLFGVRGVDQHHLCHL